MVHCCAGSGVYSSIFQRAQEPLLSCPFQSDDKEKERKRLQEAQTNSPKADVDHEEEEDEDENDEEPDDTRQTPENASSGE